MKKLLFLGVLLMGFLASCTPVVYDEPIYYNRVYRETPHYYYRYYYKVPPKHYYKPRPHKHHRR